MVTLKDKTLESLKQFLIVDSRYEHIDTVVIFAIIVMNKMISA